MLQEIIVYKSNLDHKKYLLVFGPAKKILFFSIIDEDYLVESIYNLKVTNINYQNQTAFVSCKDMDYFVNLFDSKVQLGSSLLCQLVWLGNDEKQPKVKVGFNLIGKYVVINNNKINKYSCNINSVIDNYVNDKKITGVVFRSSVDSLNNYDLLFNELDQLINIRNFLNIQQNKQIGLLYKAPSMFIRFIREQHDLNKCKIYTNDLVSYEEILGYKESWGIGNIHYEENLLIDVNKYDEDIKNNYYIYQDIKVKFNKFSGINLIDIDNMNAKMSFYQSNLIVLDLIVEKIILKDLTGIILIDLIKNMTIKQKKHIIERMKILFNNDFRKVKIFGFTGSEMFELIRMK
jgi:ribonuclease G